MRKTPTALLALLVILLPCSAFALDPSLDISQYAHTSWKVRDGFVPSAINAIAQTPDGYLWLGTESGLYRFDGVRAVPWQPPAGQQLPSNVISALLTARDGTLWIGTSKGLATLKDGKLVKHSELNQYLVMALFEDHEGTVWAGGIASRGTLCAFRAGNVQCYGEDSRLGVGVAGIYEDRKGNLWVGVENGLWRWKPGVPDFFPMPGEMDSIRAFVEDDDGALLISTSVGIRRLAAGKVQRYPLDGYAQPFHVESMLRDRDGALWVGTRAHGLIHVYKGKPDFFSQPDGLTGTGVTPLMEDREGTIWAVTVDGLDRFRRYAIPTISVQQGLSNSLTVSVLAGSEGTVWIATINGLNRWRDGEVSLPGSQNPGRADGKFNGAAPTTMFRDSSGRLWAPTTQEFGYVANGRFVPLRDVSSHFVHSITEVPAGHLWVADQKVGLVHLSDRKILQQIPWATMGHKDHANALAADSSGRGLWLGFWQGGIAYFEDGGIRRSYSKTDGLGEGAVYDLRFGPRGTLWAGTEGGLSRIKDGHVSTLTSRNGLPCDAVHWSIEDNDDTVWLQVPCGLVRIAKSELDAWATDPNRIVKTEIFDASDGVRLSPFPGGYTPHVTKSPDGRIWFVVYDGISIIDPHNLATNKLPPPVHIEQVSADGKTYDAASGLRLPALVRNLTFDFVGLSLVAPEKNRYRFKLEGWDRNWRDTVNELRVEYTNLPPKHYKFRVMACNNSGVWNEEGATLDFIIPPAWYQTNWFREACVLAFLAMIWGVYQLRVRQLAYQFNMRLDERVHERTRIARELHDTLLQSFHGLLMNLQTVSRLLSRRPEEAQEKLDSAIEQAEEAIVEGRDAVQGLRASTVQRNDLALAISTLGEELATDSTDSSVPAFRVAVEGVSRDLHPILRDEVYRIAAEALRNAFRHARALQIEVEVRYDKQQFWLRVRDDGRGFDSKVPAGQERDGHYGLPGMRERAKIAGGKLTVWSEVGAGTEVELEIPASTAYAKVARRSWFSVKLAGKQ